MLQELVPLEPQLKQILYGCVEHLQATKAAVYLPSSHDLTDKRYEIVSSYQFNDAGRRVVGTADDLVDKLCVKRTAFFVNGLGSDPRFSEMLFRQGTDRMLAVPIFARGRFIGFIDMRDKAGKKPFAPEDLDRAKRISEQVAELVASAGLFGLAPIKLAEEPDEPPQIVNPGFRPTPAAPATTVTAPAIDRRYSLSAEAVRAVETAREIVAKRAVRPEERRALTEADFEVVRLLLPATLAIPGAVLACFSAIGHTSRPQAVVAIATVTDDAMEMLQRHLQSWLRRTNHPHLAFDPLPPQMFYPFGAQVVPVSASGISTILSAPVNPESWDGLVLTVAFERTPEAQAQRALQMFLRQIEQSVETAIAAGTGRNDRQRVAEKLLEPDFQRYPLLVEHSIAVSVLSHRLAESIGLAPPQVETIRLAALVHDAGLRLLDYDRLYAARTLSPEEKKALQEHPIVGAALVEPLLGPEIAQIVLRHHERVDGTGYPSRMNGNSIPGGARIIQICDAWVAMTSPRSYQTRVAVEEASWRIRQGAGSQFDEGLSIHFLKHINDLTE